MEWLWGRELVHTKNANAGEVVFPKLAPQALVEAGDMVVSIGSALAVGNAVEKVAVVGALLPHAFHLGATGLEVSEVLLPQPGLLVDGDLISLERGGFWVVGGQGLEYAFGGLSCSSVGGGEELDGVVGAEEGS